MSKSSGRNRRTRNTVTTRSGNTIKINRTLSDKFRARKAARPILKLPVWPPSLKTDGSDFFIA